MVGLAVKQILLLFFSPPANCHTLRDHNIQQEGAHQIWEMKSCSRLHLIRAAFPETLKASA
jgi:hypothetical protein